YLALMVAPGVLTLVRGGSDLAGAATFAALVGAAGAAFCTWDPTPHLSATPVSRAARQVVVGGVACAAIALVLGAAAGVATAFSADLGPIADRGPEAGAAAGLSLAL